MMWFMQKSYAMRSRRDNRFKTSEQKLPRNYTNAAILKSGQTRQSLTFSDAERRNSSECMSGDDPEMTISKLRQTISEYEQ